MCVWNTSHLLKRSLETYIRQDFPKDDWELIIIDDNSEDDVLNTILPYTDKLNIRYKRLDHNYGMRGNTVAFNTGFEMAKGDVLAETTPEILLPPQTIKRLYEEHVYNERAFVAIKTYNLVYETQMLIDTVDWKSDIMNISKLPGWDDPITQANAHNVNFRTHQLCSIKAKVFWEITKGYGFPLFGDYGSEDPWYSGRREQFNPIVDNITVMDFMAIHQWHMPFQFWMSKGRAPMLNKWAHSMENYLHDKTGEVPAGGSCQIWDAGSHEMLTEQDRINWMAFDDKVINTGVYEHIVKRLK
jgi:glycosyltransferase involved in cell wall biosynthesis